MGSKQPTLNGMLFKYVKWNEGKFKGNKLLWEYILDQMNMHNVQISQFIRKKQQQITLGNG